MSKPRAARRADEQLYAQILFQFLDGTGQRRLLDMQPFGGPRKVKLFSDCKEATKVAQFHNGLPSDPNGLCSQPANGLPR
jgi:hypothetical protein